jgi:hypothetical protein
MATAPVPDFPKLGRPAIHELKTADITARRKDGGLALLIVVSQPLDGFVETLDAVHRQVG